MRASLGERTNRTAMSSSSSASIAKKARTKAEADFATWLMMAKLGGFDDLPSNAQSFLINYRNLPIFPQQRHQTSGRPLLKSADFVAEVGCGRLVVGHIVSVDRL